MNGVGDWQDAEDYSGFTVHRLPFTVRRPPFTIQRSPFTVLMKPGQSHFHAVRGLRYHVRTWGESAAPKIFLLHGWMDVSASFQYLVEAFARDWYIVAPDWRGFGHTQWADHGYWFPDYYADLEVILDLYQPQMPVQLVGHSMGGNIAGIYAGLRPARVAKLAILEGLGLVRTGAEAAPDRLSRWLDAQTKPPRFTTYASFDELAARLKRNNSRLTEDKAMFLARQWGRQTDSGAVELLSDPRHKAPNPYLYRIDEALACWRRVTAPVLLVTARNSHIQGWMKDSPKQLAERKAAFRNLKEATLEDCGHMMHHDQPQRLGALLEGFFTEESLL